MAETAAIAAAVYYARDERNSGDYHLHPNLCNVVDRHTVDRPNIRFVAWQDVAD